MFETPETLTELVRAAEECEIVGRLAASAQTRRLNRIRAAALRRLIASQRELTEAARTQASSR